MALTGLCLVLFVTFHVLMNAVAICWPVAYNMICQFLGANWYALVGSLFIAALFIIHIIYASWLTIQNRRARGNDRYAVNARPEQVEWSSKNMYILGIVVLAFLVVHLIQFWSKMQLQEIVSHNPADWASVDGAAAAPAMGTLFIQAAFAQPWTLIVYGVGFVALWLHLNHGIWSMLQTTGLDNRTWLPRLRKTALVWSTIVCGLFMAEGIVFTVNAHNHHYTTNAPIELQEQYAQVWKDKIEDLNTELAKTQTQAMKLMQEGKGQEAQQLFMEKRQSLMEQYNYIDSVTNIQCPDAKYVLQMP